YPCQSTRSAPARDPARTSRATSGPSRLARRRRRNSPWRSPKQVPAQPPSSRTERPAPAPWLEPRAPTRERQERCVISLLRLLFAPFLEELPISRVERGIHAGNRFALEQQLALKFFLFVVLERLVDNLLDDRSRNHEDSGGVAHEDVAGYHGDASDPHGHLIVDAHHDRRD